MENNIDLKKLRQSVASRYSFTEGFDQYFFLLRIGGNYDKYTFNWEPFRDLAGPLQAGRASLPIVVISDPTTREKVEVRRENNPILHYEFWVSPTIPVEEIATAWLELLVDDGAMLGVFKGPFNFFAHDLKISVDKLSKKARKFLNL